MNLKEIQRKVENRKSKPLDIRKHYSVLLPLINIDEEIHILFEVRSNELTTQPGEISFPGGMVEDNEDYKDAAVRETWEELNIAKDNIKVIGELDYMISLFNFKLHIYCGLLDGVDVKRISPNQDEVDHVFTVPLKFFLKNTPREYCIELETVIDEDFPYHLIQNGRNYNWRRGKYPVFFYIYKDYVIWGMTARFIKNFIDILKGNIE